MWVCLSICLFATKILANWWPDMVHLCMVASHGPEKVYNFFGEEYLHPTKKNKIMTLTGPNLNCP